MDEHDAWAVPLNIMPASYATIVGLHKILMMWMLEDAEIGNETEGLFWRVSNKNTKNCKNMVIKISFFHTFNTHAEWDLKTWNQKELYIIINRHSESC